MIKKTLTLLLALAFAASVLIVPVSAKTIESAADLPFELTAPANVYAEWQQGNDSPTTTILTYSLSNEMTDFFKRMDNAALDETIGQFMQEVGCDDIWMSIQIDWALDDVDDTVSGWHYNEYWNGTPGYGLGIDGNGCYRYGEWDGVDLWIGNATETVNDLWLTRYVSEAAYNGNPDTGTPGLKDQMREGQYEYKYDEDAEDYILTIDYSEHTMYFRARFAVTVRNDGVDDVYYFSDWSNVTCVGKNAPPAEPLTAEDLPAPVITSLYMTDREFNDNPVVAFTLTVPDALAENASKVQAAGGYISIEIEGRVQGDTAFVGLQGDWIIKGGEMEACLFNLVSDERPTVPKDTVVELRCRYRYDHPRFFEGDIYSEYSKTISFGTDDITQGGSTPTDPDHKDTVDLSVARLIHNRKLPAKADIASDEYSLESFVWYQDEDGATSLGSEANSTAGTTYDAEFVLVPKKDGVNTANAEIYVNSDIAPRVTVTGEKITVRFAFYCPKGDLDKDSWVTDQDAVYLLFNTFFPDDYPVDEPVDYDHDEDITDQDAVYLLFFTFFPEDYPI